MKFSHLLLGLFFSPVFSPAAVRFCVFDRLQISGCHVENLVVHKAFPRKTRCGASYQRPILFSWSDVTLYDVTKYFISIRPFLSKAIFLCVFVVFDGQTRCPPPRH